MKNMSIAMWTEGKPPMSLPYLHPHVPK